MAMQQTPVGMGGPMAMQQTPVGMGGPMAMQQTPGLNMQVDTGGYYQ